jgi:hypothetical protein
MCYCFSPFPLLVLPRRCRVHGSGAAAVLGGADRIASPIVGIGTLELLAEYKEDACVQYRLGAGRPSPRLSPAREPGQRAASGTV